MKLLGGGNDDRNVVRETPVRSQDDAAVGYVFQRPHPHDGEFNGQFIQKQQQPRWATGDETIDSQDKWQYNVSLHTNAPSGGAVGVGLSGGANGGTVTVGNNTGSISMAQTASKHTQMLNHHHQQHHNPHLSHQQLQNPLNTQNHLNSTVLSHALGNPAAAGLPMPMQTIQGNIYDHVHPGINVNGIPKPTEQLVYLGGQPHLGMLAPQNQFLTATNRNSAAITTSTAKKLWEKNDVKGPSGGGPLNPLHIPGVADHTVWKDSTWSTQGETILVPPRPRTFPQAADTNQTGSTGILSPRDSTSGLGVKMVEYVLGGSPTNKESPLSSLEPRLRALKFDDGNKTRDDKEKANSPFDTNGLKKEDQVNANGVVVNGIDDDKGFNRTPGSRQPSPAEESLGRPPTLLDPQTHVGSVFPQHHLQHMLGSAMDHQSPAPQLNSYHHPQLQQMNQLQPPLLNGVGGMQVAQSQMLNQNQGPNQESPANLLQQPPNFDVQVTSYHKRTNVSLDINRKDTKTQKVPMRLSNTENDFRRDINKRYLNMRRCIRIDQNTNAIVHYGFHYQGSPI